jgi:hypothetical protein
MRVPNPAAGITALRINAWVFACAKVINKKSSAPVGYWGAKNTNYEKDYNVIQSQFGELLVGHCPIEC